MEKVSLTNVETVVFSAVDRLKELLPPNTQLEPSRSSLLLGGGTSLDSMAVVNLLVFIEEELSRQLGIAIMLAGVDEDGGIDPKNLDTVGTLIDAIFARIS